MLEPRVHGVPEVERELFVRKLVTAQMAGTDPPESVVAQLIRAMREVHFRAQEVVFARGRSPEWLYVIRAGAIELRRDGEPTWKFTGGSTVGGIDALIGRAHERDAIAIENTSCLAIRSADYFDVLEDHPQFCHQVVAHQAMVLQQKHLELPEPDKRLSKPRGWRLIRPGARELGIVERLLVLHKVPAFAGSSIQPLVSLAERAGSRAIDEGAVLFRQGDQAGTFWVIASGTVEISRDRRRHAVRGAGELIESFASFGHAVRQYTARALAPLVMVAIDKEELFDRMEEHFELTRSVMAYIARAREALNRSEAEGRSTLQGAG